MGEPWQRYHQVVLTAGISVFAPRNVFGAWARETGLFAFTGISPAPGDDLEPEACLAAWDERCRQVDIAPAQQQPTNVSAEVSLLQALQARHRLGAEPGVTLVVTDTFAGRAAATLVRRCIERLFGGHVSYRFIADIAVDEPERLRRSLGAMMGEIAQALGGGDPSFTCFAPVGGYKVITSLGYLVGAYLGFPTAYLHEDNQILHEIPAVPIRVSPADLTAAFPLIRRCWYGPLELATLSGAERALLEQFAFLFEQCDGLTDLTAFGRFLADRPELLAHTRPQVLATEEVADLLAGGHRRFVAQQIAAMVERLPYAISMRGEFRHDTTFDRLKGAQYALYKGAANGTPVFYAAYAHNQAAVELRLRRIWLHHDTYLREAQSGTGFFDHPEALQWVSISELVWSGASSS